MKSWDTTVELLNFRISLHITDCHWVVEDSVLGNMDFHFLQMPQTESLGQPGRLLQNAVVNFRSFGCLWCMHCCGIWQYESLFCYYWRCVCVCVCVCVFVRVCVCVCACWQHCCRYFPDYLESSPPVVPYGSAVVEIMGQIWTQKILVSCLFLSINVCVHVCVCVCMRACACVHACMCVCMHMCAHMCMQPHVLAFICLCACLIQMYHHKTQMYHCEKYIWIKVMGHCFCILRYICKFFFQAPVHFSTVAF